jgi:hypothetical protein
MIKFLSVKSPFLVGILYQYAPRIKSIEGLSDVFCVNVDTNELNTVNMATPRITVPDMLKKNNRKTEAASAVEMLANDLEEVFLADQKLWQHDGKVSGGKNEKQDEIGLKAFDYSAESVTSENAATSGSGSKRNLFGKLTKQPSKSGSSTKKFMSLEEKRQYATSLDAAVAFGKMIRSNCSKESGEQLNGYKSTTQEEEFVAPKYSSPSLEILGDIGSIEACTVAENEGGEENVRAALTCFFIHLYGDMGMYLSETMGEVDLLWKCCNLLHLLLMLFLLLFRDILVRSQEVSPS